MSFYTSTYETDDGGWAAELRQVSPPFVVDPDGETDYNETVLMLAFGLDKEAALLQLRASLNSALGGVELDILRHRGRNVEFRIDTDMGYSEEGMVDEDTGITYVDESRDEEDEDDDDGSD